MLKVETVEELLDSSETSYRNIDFVFEFVVQTHQLWLERAFAEPARFGVKLRVVRRVDRTGYVVHL